MSVVGAGLLERFLLLCEPIITPIITPGGASDPFTHVPLRVLLPSMVLNSSSCWCRAVLGGGF